MNHACLDCGHKFFAEGQSEDMISPAAQCPNCDGYSTKPYRDQPSPTVSDMAPRNMPDTAKDTDPGGNPLQEGFMNGYQNRDTRDESFPSMMSHRLSLFETPEFDTPEFQTEQLILPPDLYGHALRTEAAHKANVQLPKGITDNLHAALGNLQAWVENPYENGDLRPYYNKYWQVIRPSFMKPGSMQIGVADPTMAEILNHVAQTDDLTPLYEYRGRTSSRKESLMALPALGEELAGIGAADAAGGAAAAGGADAAGGGGLLGGIGSMVKKVLNPGNIIKGMGIGTGSEMAKNMLGYGLGSMDDVLGMGGGGGQAGGQGGGGGAVMDPSFYAHTLASDENDAYPDSHDEIPQNEDGDHKQQDDGNNHEWQRDISVNGVGGADHTPSFDPGGPAFQRFMMLAPLLMQYLQSGEDGSQDPLIQGLHHSLESEIPGYLDHADDDAGQQLIMMLSPKDAPEQEAEPEHNKPDHTDENSGGMHHSRVAALSGVYVGEFLPDLEVELPYLQRTAGPMGGPPMGGPPMAPPSPMSGPPAMPATPSGAGAAYSQGPTTDEQQAWFANWLDEHGRSDEVPAMIANPQLYAKDFAQARQRETPPQNTDDAGMSSNPPMPAQEDAPPGDTMPVPGMDAGQAMMSAVRRYAADSVATACPKCGSHTTELIDQDGSSHCHGCGATFKTPDKEPNTISTESASTWHVDTARHSAVTSFNDDLQGADDEALVKGVPIADQTEQRDLRQEQDSGHTWLDEDGNPLKVGQEYEMYSDKFDIPDLARIEAVKPGSLVYTLTGEYGLGHSTELTKEEADVERITFEPTVPNSELGSDDSLEHNNDDNSAYTGAPEQRDLSAPSGLVSASVTASGVDDQHNPKLAWLVEGMPRTAGANFTPMEQRALIDERGTARNADLLDLTGTHYVHDADDDQFLFGL